ncbi:hypothetical protein HA402_013691 [Bradysia odoriphaga]|nr:hypothetical protein HA402_013691 [Bradysia odoriphaga]
MEMALNSSLSVNTANLLGLDLYSVGLNKSSRIYNRFIGKQTGIGIEKKNFAVPDGAGDVVLEIYGNPWLSFAQDLHPGDFLGIEYIMIYDPLTSDNSSCMNYHPPEAQEETFCRTIDFNQPSLSLALSDFDSCEDEQLPPLTIKSYENSTISPYRESATFYLSSRTEGMSCLQMSKVLTLDTNSRISSAIYLNTLWPGAWVEIYVYDKVTHDRQVVLSVESSSNEWRSLVGSVNRKFDNAQIFIETNAQIHNSLAIEFLNITRTDDKCSNV